MHRITAVTLLIAALAACYPSGHTQTARTLEPQQLSLRVGIPALVLGPYRPEGEDREALQPVFPTSVDLGAEYGVTGFLSAGASVKVGLLMGAEAGLRARLLRAGPLHVGLGGEAGVFGFQDGVAWATGRPLLAVDVGDSLAVCASGNLGLWDLAEDPVLVRGFSVGLDATGLELFSGIDATGTMMLSFDWGIGSDLPLIRLGLGYGLHP